MAKWKGPTQIFSFADNFYHDTHPTNITIIQVTIVFRVLCFVLIQTFSGMSLAYGDEVQLTNGDRISGTILRMEEQALVLKTSYGGEIRLNWEVIEGLRSDSPMTIELLDGSRLRGIVRSLEPEEIIMIDPEEVVTPPKEETKTRTIPLTMISSINPLPNFRYMGNTSVGGNRTAGNSSTQAINGSADWTFRFYKAHRARVGGRYNYGESGNTVTARNARASLEYDYFISDSTFLNFDELFEQDSFQDLTVRSSTTVGLGYQFFDNEEHALAIVGGSGFVLQDFRTRSTIRNPSGLWSIDWRYWLITNGVEVFLGHRGFQDFGGESSALRINSNQGLRIKLNRYIFVTFEYDIRFNSQPFQNNKKLDEALIFGIGFDIGN